MPREPRREVSAEILIGFQPDATAVATVATIRPTERNKFFPTKTNATVTTGAGKYCDDGFVNEFHIYWGLGAWDWGLENLRRK